MRSHSSRSISSRIAGSITLLVEFSRNCRLHLWHWNRCLLPANASIFNSLRRCTNGAGMIGKHQQQSLLLHHYILGTTHMGVLSSWVVSVSPFCVISFPNWIPWLGRTSSISLKTVLISLVLLVGVCIVVFVVILRFSSCAKNQLLEHRIINYGHTQPHSLSLILGARVADYWAY